MRRIIIFILLVKVARSEVFIPDGIKLAAHNAQKHGHFPFMRHNINADIMGQYFKMNDTDGPDEDLDEITKIPFGNDSIELVENDFEGFFMGGSDAKKDQFPYQVSLIDEESSMHICSAAIINKFHVITAAHCICGNKSKKADKILILAGMIELSPEKSKKYIGKRKFCHPDYDESTKLHDIAILRTLQPFPFNSHIQPIEMDESEVKEKLFVTISGWGDNLEQTEIQSRLQFIDTSTITLSKCYGLLKKFGKGEYLKPFNICTYNKDRSVCSGDAGGPVVADNLLIGVVSWSMKCDEDIPGVHTGIEHHYSWIQDIFKEEKKRWRRMRRRY